MTAPEVFVVKDRDLLLDAVAARIVTLLVDRLAAATHATLLVDDTPLVVDLWSRLATSTLRDAVEWPRTQYWSANGRFGGERPRELDRVLAKLGVRDDALHQFPALAAADRPEDAAAAYASELAASRQPDEHAAVPVFDVAMLAVGADGSVAGLHPERPTAHEEAPVAVDRVTQEITLTSQAISVAREVWLLAAGADRAAGVRLALSSAGPYQVPAAAVRGTARTLVLVDGPAAERLPPELRRLASP